MKRLVVRGVAKAYGARRVLHDVGFTIDTPGVVAVVGTNGAGKSTLLRVIAGVLRADDGVVEVNKRALGFVPEAADPFPHLLVGDFIALVASLRRVPRAFPEELGVDALLGQRLGALSLGQRRRVCLAAALLGEPWLLVLDEPTNGLDVAGVATLASILRAHVARGGAALVATHDVAFAAEVAARTFTIVDGGIRTSGS